MHAQQPLIAHSRTGEEEASLRVRAALVAVAGLAMAGGAIALQSSTRLALLSVAVVLGWSRLTDP